MKEFIIFIANRWGTVGGGINSFNYDLSIAVAKRRKKNRREKTICLLLHSVNDIEKREIEDQYGLKLIAVLDEDDESNEGATTLPVFLGKLNKLVGFRTGEDSLIWIGHDIKTGNYANLCREKYGGRALVFNHMNYSEYYYLATQDEEKEERKEDLQRKVLQDADWVCAVGPVLKDYSEDIRHEKEKNNVTEFIPGLLEVDPSSSLHNTFKVRFFGRVDKKNNYIKQPRLAIAAFANAYEIDRKNKNTVFKNNPRMEVYGYPPEITEDDRNELKEIVSGYTSETLNITPRKYIENRIKLGEIIRSSSLCIMVSRHEGFGLVAYEAISAGVPVIISDNSGLHRFLENKKGEDVRGLYKVVHIEGNTDDFGKPAEADIKSVSDAILEIFRNYRNCKQDALRLREILRNEQYTWDNQAGTLLNLIHDLQDGNNDALEETTVESWDRENAAVDLYTYIAHEFLPNMCNLLLDCTYGDYSNYAKCVLVRFDKEKGIRYTVLVADSEPTDKGKTRVLKDGVVGMMLEFNSREEIGDQGIPIFYDFYRDNGYKMMNGEITLFETDHIPGEQDENLRAILVLPLVYDGQLEGAVTLDFYNLAFLYLDQSNNELKKIMKRGMRCMEFLKTLIFKNFTE